VRGQSRKNITRVLTPRFGQKLVEKRGDRPTVFSDSAQGVPRVGGKRIPGRAEMRSWSKKDFAFIGKGEVGACGLLSDLTGEAGLSGKKGTLLRTFKAEMIAALETNIRDKTRVKQGQFRTIGGSPGQRGSC